MNAVPELSSMAMPNPSALFCLSNAFRSRTLKAGERTHMHTGTGLRGLVKSDRFFSLFFLFLQSLTCMTA